MELKQIAYFEQVYRYRSITKAAAAMYVSQQGMSKQIASLEKEFGARLFVRTSRGVEPTDDGHFFHEQAVRLLEVQNDISAHFFSGKRKASVLQIGVSHGLETFFSEQFFRGFSEIHSDVHVKTVSMWDPLTEDNISSDDIDAGFTLAPVRLPDLHAESVLMLPLLCIVNTENPLAEKDAVTLDEILDYTVVIANENFNSYHGFTAMCAERNRNPVTVKTFDLLSIYDYVNRHSDAVGFSLDAFRDSIRYPRVKHLPINDPSAFWNICFAWKKENSSGLLRAFASYSKRYFEEHPVS